MSPAFRSAIALAAAAALHACALFGAQRLFKSATMFSVAKDESVMIDLVVTPPKPLATPEPPKLMELPLPPRSVVEPRKEVPPVLSPVEKPPSKIEPLSPPPQPKVQPVTEPLPLQARLEPMQVVVPEPPPAPVAEQPILVPVLVAHASIASGPGLSPTRTAARSNPAYYQNQAPRYPESARRAGATGLVLLHISVGADGRVVNVTIKNSSGSAILDRAAHDAAKRWRFEPARLGGVAVADDVEVPIRFLLEQP